MKKDKPHIISVSRRTDIPAYFANWFRDRLEKGYVYYMNPLSHEPVYVDLSPENVRAFVFWTRNPKPLIEHLDFIDKKYNKRHYMHFTINGLPKELEERNPKVDFAIDLVKQLSERYGDFYVQWRFDPIIISNITDEEYILSQFEYIARKLSGYIQRCYFSYVDFYKKTIINLKIISKKYNIELYDYPLEKRIALTKDLKSISDRYNIKMYACAEDNLLKPTSVEKAHCVDYDLIQKVSGNDFKYKEVPSRIECGCIESKDIGYYDSCPHGCIYCYANMDPEKALENARMYLKNGFPYDNLPRKNNNVLSTGKNQIKMDI
ncbi:MAG TPA: DUF1848 domain-containing protein [Bacteroidota bacterium]|nr:DUF1848 domain-containing protein [Bacteroidota bacterium]